VEEAQTEMYYQPREVIERRAKAEAYEDAAAMLYGDVLLTNDEFEGKTKLKVFDLLERIASTLRARAKNHIGDVNEMVDKP
jgi:hypothetical protein